MTSSDELKRWDGPGLEAWDAWRPTDVAAKLVGVDVAWHVAGGWALDLWLGEQSRLHDDLEIAIPRAAFPRLREHWSEFAFHSVGDGEVCALQTAEAPALSRHQVWVLDTRAERWRTDIFLEPGDRSTWRFRRDPRVHAPREQVVKHTEDGVPFLAPEVVLLFKAKALRPKDRADFERCAPYLPIAARSWLLGALELLHPGHAWIEELAR